MRYSLLVERGSGMKYLMVLRGPTLLHGMHGLEACGKANGVFQNIFHARLTDVIGRSTESPGFFVL